MTRKFTVPVIAALVLASSLVQAQQAKRYRVGFIHEGGSSASAIVDGLKDGLKELGFEEGKQYVLEIHDLKGHLEAVEAAAHGLEREHVDVICTEAASVTSEVKRVTTRVPVVFAVGRDPVAAGLVESFAKPGGRLTGVHTQQSADLIAKRMEILKAILPDMRRVVAFYDPGNPSAAAAIASDRVAARQLHIDILERRVASVEEFRTGLSALDPHDADAFFFINDAVVSSQSQFIIDTARAKKLPTMLPWPSLVSEGSLAGYGVSYREAGRMLGKYVVRVLTGTSPKELPVESLSRVESIVNLKTAKEIGVTIPPEVLLRADEVIQ